ncbi:hypothetical protein VZT92_016705 [Zoarces viviparus]|uniref:Uncharacterized protein n=1 Tax=Zoarces viviparus TaxID=48416 RepID=A0AAW1EUI9_ZOAVI
MTSDPSRPTVTLSQSRFGGVRGLWFSEGSLRQISIQELKHQFKPKLDSFVFVFLILMMKRIFFCGGRTPEAQELGCDRSL